MDYRLFVDSKTMNTKIVTPEQAINIAKQIRAQGSKIVLAGGCFDVLHKGHITFLEKAKQAGDILFLFVENDETIKKTKGEKRPFNIQNDRATVVSHLDIVDYVITLPPIYSNNFYDELVTKIKPAIIATTTGDASRFHKERQAKKINAQVIDVTELVENQSTTRLIKLLNDL